MNKIFIVFFLIPTIVWADPFQEGRRPATTAEGDAAANSNSADGTNGAGVPARGSGTAFCPSCVNKANLGTTTGFTPGTPSVAPSGAGTGPGVD